LLVPRYCGAEFFNYLPCADTESARSVAAAASLRFWRRGSNSSIINVTKGGFMESVLLDVAGHRRSPATMPGYHRGRPPRNKGEQYPADPPTVEEIAEAIRRLEAAGAAAPEGRSYHVALETGGEIQVFDVWESQAAFDAFGQTLVPNLSELGVDPGEPMVSQVHNIMKG
jgi:hypothetical protein